MNYFANKSHVYTTSKTCEVFNAIDNVECKLLSTDDSLLDKKNRDNFFLSIGVSPFPVESIKSVSNFFKENSFRIINWLETIFVNITLLRYVLQNRRSFDVLYFRDATLIIPILISKYLLNKPLFMELHAVLHKNYKRWLTEIVARRADGLISISGGLKKYYDNINNVGIVSFCSASDPNQFRNITETQSELRAELKLPQNKIILGYAGNLSLTGNYDSYGFEDIIKSLPLMDDNIILVGIGQKNIEETKHLINLAEKLEVKERVYFLPKVPKNQVAKYLKSFDILVHPKAGAQIGNSPAKLFEWLLSGRPIIAANTPAIEEILSNGVDSLLVEYREPKSWVKAVKEILTNKSLEKKIIEGALINAKKNTWEKRSQDIINFIKKTLKIHE